jgi:hypothetical protein
MKFPKIPVLLATIAMSISPMAGQAQDRSLMCGAQDDLEQFGNMMYLFLGPWNAQHLSGYVTMGPMMLPFPADNEVEVLNFEQSGRAMIATHPEMQEPMVFKRTNEPAWRFAENDADNGIPAPTLSSEDLELMMNCDIEEMPRLIGRTTVTVEGIAMNFVWRMMLVDFEHMYVVQHVTGTMQGMPFFSRRTVSLSRATNWEQPPVPDLAEEDLMDFTLE